MIEDYSQAETSSSDKSVTRRSFLRGEFLVDWLTRRRQPETIKDTSKQTERPAPKLGEIAELAYLAHDKEPLPKEIAVETSVEETVLSDGELRRQQREDSLRRQLVGLKMGTPNLETERQNITERQTAFGNELPGQRNQLTNLNQEAQKNSNQHLVSDSESNLGDIGEEGLKQLAVTSPEVKPAAIFDTAREAAEQNIPIEDMYERRHERKDESDDAISTTVADNYQPSKLASQNVAPVGYEAEPYLVESRLANQKLDPISKPIHVSLYKQAILAGFWTAIVLVLLGIVLLILSR